MRRIYGILIASVVALIMIRAEPVWAHRPYFEEEDIKAADPWGIQEPTVSTALYATLEDPEDTDYYRFAGDRGQEILIGLTIPQIEGQKDFVPTLALLGPGLGDDPLPERIAQPDGAGILVIPPLTGEPETFFEPFSRTSYWERQEERVKLPASGEYIIAVWHQDGQVGRYVLVVGDKERLGGDLAFPVKMRSYWTPVGAEEENRGLLPRLADTIGQWIQEMRDWVGDVLR